jgi:isoquinoline 1-oxidoreductase beta subunit
MFIKDLQKTHDEDKEFSALSNTSRRNFLIGSGGLVVGLTLPFNKLAFASGDGAKESQQVNAWVEISPSGVVTIASPNAEMGQGTMTAMPLILAEELDADWSKVIVKQVGPTSKEYGNPFFGGIIHTVGSLTTAALFDKVRLAGAQARLFLLERAAAHWKVPVSQLQTDSGYVKHNTSNKTMSYGKLVSISREGDKIPTVKKTDLKKSSDYKLIGKNIPRVDVPAKVDGTAEYGMDVVVPGMVHASIIRAPMHGATVKSFQNDNKGEMAKAINLIKLPFGLAVLGQDLELILNARKNIEVKWNLPKTGRKYDSENALKEYSKISEDKNISGVNWWQPFFPKSAKGKKGYLQSALSDPKLKKLSATYQTEHVYHGQLEPMNATALVDKSGKKAEIWAPTQAVSVTTFAAAGILKTSPQSIKVNTTFLGGGFGRRAQVDYIVDAVVLSKITKKPVKVVWTREDDVGGGGFRANSAMHLEAAFNQKGKIEAWSHRTVSESPLKFYAPNLLGKNGEDILVMSGSEQLQYNISAQSADHVVQDNGTRLAAWRGIGHGQNKFASECFMDEIAVSLKLDPAKFRVNAANNPRTKAVLERVIKMSGWGKKRNGVGQGIAYSDYNGSHSAGVAEISLDRKTGKIKVKKFFIAIDAGLAVLPNNVIAQIEGSVIYGISAALTEKITHKGGVVEQSNFHDYEVMRMSEVPEVSVEIIQGADRPSSVGELGLPAVGPAISNALFQLTGKRARSLPMNEDAIKELIKA